MKTLCLLPLFLAPFATAQTLNLSGTVVDKAGRPVVGAVVELVSKGLKDTTGSDGGFAFTGSSNGTAPRGHFESGVKLDRGTVVVSLAQASATRIDVFDAQGGILQTRTFPLLGAGVQRFDMGPSPSPRFVFVRVRTDDRTLWARGLWGGNVAGSEDARSLPSLLGRALAAVDTLRTNAWGFQTSTLELTALAQTGLQVVLDSMAGPATPSAGCGKAPGMVSGIDSMMSASSMRSYTVDIPSRYDQNRPNRLVFGLHWMGGTMKDVATGSTFSSRGTWAFYGFKSRSDSSTIYIAPQGLGDPTGWGSGEADQTFLDELVAKARNSLCIDTSRVFSIGFSYGAAMSSVLGAKRPNVFRAVVVLDGGQMSGDPRASGKVAYMATHGLDTADIVDVSWGRSLRDKFAKANGCPTQTPTETVTGSKTHVCYEYNGCDPRYPVKWCTFDGGHTPLHVDGSANSGPGDLATKSWIPEATWKFISQF